MILLTAKAKHFGSYQDLEFNYSDLGLSLIHGATGSGKSTLQDLSLWLLFGVTAKDGNVDEIRPWYALDTLTEGELTLQAKDNTLITIYRTRGKPSQNDLYWIENTVIRRGKDITETQKLLEVRLSVSKDLYLSAACYNEFSPTSTFFTNKAKDRRELFEKIAILDLPIKLAEGASNERKLTKKILEERERTHAKAIGQLEQLQSNIEAVHNSIADWRIKQDRTIASVEEKSKNFERDKEEKIKNAKDKYQEFEDQRNESIKLNNQKLELSSLSLKDLGAEICKSCGQENKHLTKMQQNIYLLKEKVSQKQKEKNPYFQVLEQVKVTDNYYEEHLTTELTKENPFIAQLASLQLKENDLQLKVSQTAEELEKLTKKVNALAQLYDLSFELRGVLLNRIVSQIQDEANRLLTEYFDSELKVQFKIESSDDLKIEIFKSGHTAVFKQLSKGQRSLLKLSFSLAIMKASANKAGIHFNVLSFDEALDGLDSSLKLKAYRLFEELAQSHETVLVIDHDEDLKGLFTRKFHVSIEGDHSRIEER